GVVSKNKSQKSEPIIGKSIRYIVAAVIFNDDNEVLMIEESKAKCRHKWSLPSGKAEPNEQIVDAVKREAFEESGLEIEPTALVVVESSGGNWFRFTFTARVIGGQLKTVADAESIQALWCSQQFLQKANLRSEDTLNMIEFVRKSDKSYNPFIGSQFVAIEGHNRTLLRLVFAVERRRDQFVLVSELPSPHLPVCDIHPTNSLNVTLNNFIKWIFMTSNIANHWPLGVFTVEHNGVPEHSHDGLCLTVLVKGKGFIDAIDRPPRDYAWIRLSQPLESVLNTCLNSPKSELIYWRAKYWSKRKANKSFS
ncbi:unnamed protein product, partial [Medioppia subpectinata]